MEKEKLVSVFARVLDPACLDAAKDALEDRGMLVLYRVLRKNDGLVVGMVDRTARPLLDLVIGCQVKEL